MKFFKLEDFTRGWLVGHFEPAIVQTDQFEVGCKSYTAGEKESAHVHKIATEITVIVSGQVKMNGVKYQAGDIIVIEPGEATDFEALTDVTTTVIKLPSAKNDKYLV